MSTIPVFSVVIRYNLVENNLCRKITANFWAVVFPWILAIPFYTGSGFLNVINWTSLFVNGFVNLVLPFVFYLLALQQARGITSTFVAIPDIGFLNRRRVAWGVIPLVSMILIATIIGNIVKVA